MKRPDCSLVQNMKKLQKSLKGRCAMDFKHEPDTNFKRPEALSGDILFARLQELEEKQLEKYTRSQARRKVQDQGARATSSISSQTDYLVVGANPGSKLAEAEKQKSIRIIHENRFQKMVSH